MHIGRMQRTGRQYQIQSKPVQMKLIWALSVRTSLVCYNNKSKYIAVICLYSVKSKRRKKSKGKKSARCVLQCFNQETNEDERSAKQRNFTRFRCERVSYFALCLSASSRGAIHIPNGTVKVRFKPIMVKCWDKTKTNNNNKNRSQFSQPNWPDKNGKTVKSSKLFI